MADILPPAPVDAPFGAYNWVDWYKKVRDAINNAASVAWSSVTGTPTTLAGYGITDAVPDSRTITTMTPLLGGGDLSTDRILSITTFAGAGRGVVPASSGGTTDFLRADGAWASPGGGGGSFTLTQVTITVPTVTYGEYVSNVIDATVTTTSKIVCSFHYAGDDAENGLDELDSMYVFAKANLGSIDFTLIHELGAFVGPFVINYAVSA